MFCFLQANNDPMNALEYLIQLMVAKINQCVKHLRGDNVAERFLTKHKVRLKGKWITYKTSSFYSLQISGKV